jgi:hypothetical protein
MKQWTKWMWLTLILATAVLQSACGYVAAGAAGAVIGHEAAENDNEDDEDDE